MGLIDCTNGRIFPYFNPCSRIVRAIFLKRSKNQRRTPALARYDCQVRYASSRLVIKIPPLTISFQKCEKCDCCFPIFFRFLLHLKCRHGLAPDHKVWRKAESLMMYSLWPPQCTFSTLKPASGPCTFMLLAPIHPLVTNRNLTRP